VEGDDLHPQSNVEKMASGTPLTDADREPWLALVRRTAEDMTAPKQNGVEKKDGPQVSGKTGVVISCSALKKYYREILRGNPSPSLFSAGHELSTSNADTLSTYFVFIKGSRSILLERMEKRPGHFMKAGMLDSQLGTLESPEGEDGVVVVSVEDSTEEQVRQAIEALRRVVGVSRLQVILVRREKTC
jgi:gluconokinase